MENYVSGGFSADIGTPDFGAGYASIEALDTDMSFDSLAAQTELDDLEASFALPDAELPADHPEMVEPLAAAGGTLALRESVVLEPYEAEPIIEIADEPDTEEVVATEPDAAELITDGEQPIEDEAGQPATTEPAASAETETAADSAIASLEPYVRSDTMADNPAVQLVGHHDRASELHDATTRATFAQVLEASGLSLDTASTYVTRGIDQGRTVTETINYAEVAPGVVAIEDGKVRSDGQIDNEVVIAGSLHDYLESERERQPRPALLVVTERQTLVTENEITDEVIYDTEYDLEWHGDDGAPMPGELLEAVQNVYGDTPWQPTDLSGNPVTVEHSEHIDHEPDTALDDTEYAAPADEAFRLANQAVDAVRDTIEHPTVIGPNQGK